MSSIRQIEANRRNGLRSTGPMTSEGKRRSRCNAVRHGLTAETVIAVLEDSEDYEAFEAAVISDYDAQSAVERELVLRLASVLWRLRRATGIETAFFDFVTEESSAREPRPSREDIVGDSKLAERHQLLAGMVLAPVAPTEPSPNLKRDLGNHFLRLADLPTFPLDRLSRYEYMLWRQARQIVLALDSLRRHSLERNRRVFPFSFHTIER